MSTMAGRRAATTKVLIVDADQTLAAALKDALIAEGYETAFTSSGGEAIVLAVSWEPMLVILDLALPDIDGLEVIRVLRKHSSVAIIAVSSRDLESEKIAALDRGANDIVCKPLKIGELMARGRAALRGARGFKPVTLVHQAGALLIDTATRTVTLRGHTLRFTSKEFEILHILANAQGRVVAQHDLIRAIWGAPNVDSIQYLRVFIGRLRRKIEDNPDEPKLLVTERGVGYRLILSGAADPE